VRRLFNGLSKEFAFEVFSPHKADMNPSNNCSIVCKVIEKATGATYLITGDTEDDRWSTIASEFKASLKADVLAAAHHGSDNGITAEALKYVKPHTILISAGVGNQYGHPGAGAQRLFSAHSEKWYMTNHGKGQSLRTVADGKTVSTYLFVV
jgi:beta-lactamase superfamily II metal-dependent hydrolase